MLWLIALTPVVLWLCPKQWNIWLKYQFHVALPVFSLETGSTARNWYFRPIFHSFGQSHETTWYKEMYIKYSDKVFKPQFSPFFPAFYVDCDAPAYCFVPCGHMASPKTVKYWAEVPIPCGTSGFQSACPFCAVPLTGTPGYVKLIFQAMSD